MRKEGCIGTCSSALLLSCSVYHCVAISTPPLASNWQAAASTPTENERGRGELQSVCCCVCTIVTAVVHLHDCCLSPLLSCVQIQIKRETERRRKRCCYVFPVRFLALILGASSPSKLGAVCCSAFVREEKKVMRVFFPTFRPFVRVSLSLALFLFLFLCSSLFASFTLH